MQDIRKRWSGRPLRTASRCAKENARRAARKNKEASVHGTGYFIGIDISKKSFQLHGATAEGEPVFRKTLSRGRLLAFLSEVPSCLVVMEACGGAHHWGREIVVLGHECKLIPPEYVKPFVKRQKNDSNDAAATVEAAQRPTMRFVTVKSEAYRFLRI